MRFDQNWLRDLRDVQSDDTRLNALLVLHKEASELRSRLDPQRNPDLTLDLVNLRDEVLDLINRLDHQFELRSRSRLFYSMISSKNYRIYNPERRKGRDKTMLKSVIKSVIETIEYLILFYEDVKSIDNNKLPVKARRTKRTPGEPTVPKSVRFPVSMLEDLNSAAAGRGETVNRFILDACAERLRSGSTSTPVMILLPSSIPDNLRERVERMADDFARMVKDMCDLHDQAGDPSVD